MDSIRLPDNSSIFTAEAKAIDIALYYIRDQPKKQFIIYSDSLSVLRTLKKLDHRNPLIQQIFSSPEPKAPGELIDIGRLRRSSVIRPSTISNDFSSETTGPIATKFHIQPPGTLGKKNCSMV